MKDKIIKLIDSIQGSGNLIVTKPDGTIKHKYPFQNTITEHFKRALMSAIIYGDKDEVVDASGNVLTHARQTITIASGQQFPDDFKDGDGTLRTGGIVGTFWKDAAGNRPPSWIAGLNEAGNTSNGDSIGWQVGDTFVTTASTPFPYFYSNKLIAHQFKIRVGLSGGPNNIESVKDGNVKEFDWTGTGIGESRTAVIGWVDANQTSLANGTSPSEVANDSNAEVFDFGQNVFTGMIQQDGAPPGTQEPVFKPARENLRVSTDANKNDANIDSELEKAKNWFTLDDPDLTGTKATIRQSLGPGGWRIASHRTSNPRMWAKYKLGGTNETNDTIYGGVDPSDTSKAIAYGRGAAFPSDNTIKRKQWNGSAYVDEPVVGVFSEAFYWSNDFSGDDISEFVPYDYELKEPDGDFYWSFTTDVDLSDDVVNWSGRDLETQSGKILGIEVQNFPQRFDKNASTVATDTEIVDGETIAYHIPTTDITLDRNDNITVEYNFQFSKPNSTNDVDWNIQYIDHMARALNPVGTDSRTGLPMQNTNSASRIQLTGLSIFETGVFEDLTKTQDFTHKFSDGTPEAITRTTVSQVPDSIKKKGSTWGGSQSPAAQAAGVDNHKLDDYLHTDPVHRRTAANGSYDSAGTWNKKFMRIWTSAESNSYADVSSSPTDTSSSVDFSDSSANITLAGNTLTERRSYYNQIRHVPDLTDFGVLAGNEFFNKVNKFDYFKNMVSDTNDFQNRINFEGRKIQLYLTPHGEISKRMRDHLKNTEWLKDTTIKTHYINGDELGDGPNNGAALTDYLYNIETLWQGGARVLNEDLSGLAVSDKTGQFFVVRDMALDLLYLFDSSGINESYLIQTTQYNSTTQATDSVLSLKATSDARFDTPPLFFRVFYGQDGHALPQDMKDNDIQGRWQLRSDYTDKLNESFGQFLETRQSDDPTETNGNSSRKWSDAPASDDNQITAWNQITTDGTTPLGADDHMNWTSYPAVFGYVATPSERLVQTPGQVDFTDLYKVKEIDEVFDVTDKVEYDLLMGGSGVTIANATLGGKDLFEEFDKFILNKTGKSIGGLGDLHWDNIYWVNSGELRLNLILEGVHTLADGTTIVGTTNADGIGATPQSTFQYIPGGGDATKQDEWQVGSPYTIILHDFSTTPVLLTGHGQSGIGLTGDTSNYANDYNYRGETKNKIGLTGYNATDNPSTSNLGNYQQSIVWDYIQSYSSDESGDDQEWIFNPKVYGLTNLDNFDTDTSWWTKIDGHQSLGFVNARDIVDRYTIPDSKDTAPFLISDGSGNFSAPDETGEVTLNRITRFGIYDNDWSNGETLSEQLTLKKQSALKVWVWNNGNLENNSTITVPGFHPMFGNLFKPAVSSPYDGDFYIAKSLKHGDGALQEPDDTEIGLWLGGNVYDSDKFPPLPTMLDVVNCLRSYIDAKGHANADNGTKLRNWSKDELFNWIRSIAPYGMIDMYEYFDATPDEVTIDLPSPDNDMFYGIIANPGGDDGMTNQGSFVILTDNFEYDFGSGNVVVVGEGDNDADGNPPPNGSAWAIGDRFVVTAGVQSGDPTWTKGDKLEMTWTINPPVTTNIGG